MHRLGPDETKHRRPKDNAGDYFSHHARLADFSKQRSKNPRGNDDDYQLQQQNAHRGSEIPPDTFDVGLNNPG